MHTPPLRIVTGAIVLCLAVLPVPGQAQSPPHPSWSLLLAQQPPPAQPQPPAPPPQPAQPQPAKRVTAIEVRGHKEIPTERILAAVTNTKVGDPVNDDKLRDDIRAIIDLGWFADVTVRLENEDDGVRVLFIVTENPVVSEIIVEGNTVISADDIRTALGIPTGEVLNIRRMRDGARAVQKLYEDKGYVLARVQDIGLLPTGETGETGVLRVRIVEGKVEAVKFEGLQKTKERIVRRFITIKPGDVFNVNSLNRDLQRLFDLSLFETIRARPEPGSTLDTVVIVIELKEARTAQISGGIGYSSLNGLLGFVEFRDRNWNGLGQTFAVRIDRSVQPGLGVRFNYELDFIEPFLDNRGTTLDLSLFSRSNVQTQYIAGSAYSRFELLTTGSSVTATRPLDPFTLGTARFKSERTQINPLPLDPNNSASPVVPPTSDLITPGRVMSVLLSATRDTRNNRLNPTKGDKISLSGEFAFRTLGGDFSFNKYIGEYQHIFPIGGGSVIAGRLLAGFSTGTLPVQEQFLLGGSNTIRSYPSAAFRGSSMWVANLEYRFPLGQVIRALGDFQGIVFVDAGNAPLAFNDVKFGYGVGVAVATPIGPVRIDVASGPQGIQTWLSLGAPF